MILKKILGTSGSRVLQAASNLILLWMATNFLGAEAWGLSGIILLNVSILMLVSDIIANPLIFYASKRNPVQLLNFAYKWVLIVISAAASLFGMLFLLFPDVYHLIVPQGYGFHILALVFLNSLFGINQYMLLGREKIKAFNSLYILQFSSMLGFMAVMIFVFGIKDERAFVYALYLSYFIPIIPGYSIVYKHLRSSKSSDSPARFKELFDFGSMTQLSSIVHTLNKRLGFYVLKNITGLGALGVYHSGTQLTEGMRLIGQSIALVQISSLSNRDDKAYAKNLSLQLLKFSVLLTALSVIVLLLLPSSFFALVFSKDFGGMREVILSLAPGVVALSANTIFSHYFSGTGRPKYNLFASLVGFSVTIPALFLLIPPFGMIGAGMGASMAYIATAIYQWFVFKKLSKASYKDLLINRHDIQTAANAVRALKKKTSTS